jgi:Zn-dependent peptidase ImmA (M78 family)
MQTLVLAHELTHALQDQHFDLLKFLHAEWGNDDATSARQALTVC